VGLPNLHIGMIGGLQQEGKVRGYHDQILKGERGRRCCWTEVGRWATWWCFLTHCDGWGCGEGL